MKHTKKSVSTKVVVLLLAVVLLIGCVAGGTIAYLITKTDKVTNTFVAGDVGDLNLTETTVNPYMVIPGVDIKKDPTVTFKGNNIDAYVFLKVDATDWTVSGSDTTYTYSISTGSEKKMEWTLTGWTMLENGVYYKEVAANTAEQTWHIITDDKITVSNSITKDDIANYTKSLSFTAYAIQKDSFENVAAAWNAAKAA